MATLTTSLIDPIILYENQTNVVIDATITPDQGETDTYIINYVTFTPNDGFFTYSIITGNIVRITAVSLDGIIPINHIKYRENDSLITAYNWGSVPNNCQIYNYSKSAGPITVQVTINAKGNPSDIISNFSFNITIRGDFSSGISKLLSKVNTSSEFRK